MVFLTDQPSSNSIANAYDRSKNVKTMLIKVTEKEKFGFTISQVLVLAPLLGNHRNIFVSPGKKKSNFTRFKIISCYKVESMKFKIHLMIWLIYEFKHDFRNPLVPLCIGRAGEGFACSSLTCRRQAPVSFEDDVPKKHKWCLCNNETQSFVNEFESFWIPVKQCSLIIGKLGHNRRRRAAHIATAAASTDACKLACIAMTALAQQVIKQSKVMMHTIKSNFSLVSNFI